ncbi:MAG: hypothetical protein ABIG84_01870 [archaeon]
MRLNAQRRKQNEAENPLGWNLKRPSYSVSRPGYCPHCGREISRDEINNIFNIKGTFPCSVCGGNIVCTTYENNIEWNAYKAKIKWSAYQHEKTWEVKDYMEEELKKNAEEKRKNDEEQRKKDEEFLKPILSGKSGGVFYDRMREVDDVISHDEPPNSEVFTPEFVHKYVGKSKPVGKCPYCGSDLIRDPEGHIGCSNLACKNTVFVPDKWRRYETIDHDVRQSVSIGAKKWGRIIGRNIEKNYNGLVGELDDVRQDQLRKAGDDWRKGADLGPQRQIVIDDAVRNFKGGKSYKDAVDDQIKEYMQRNWWGLRNVNTLEYRTIQKNEVKSIIWDVYQNPLRYGIDWNEIQNNDDAKKAYKSARGFLGIRGGLQDRLVKIGNDSNRKNMGKIAEMQKRLGDLGREEQQWNNLLKSAQTEGDEKKCEAELQVIAAEKKDLLDKIRLIEEHPELAKRMYVRGSGFGKRVGGLLRGGSKKFRKGKETLGKGIAEGWSAHKQKIISAIQLLLPIVVFGLMFYYSWSVPDIFPVGWLSMFIFIIVALLSGAVKSSMSENKADEGEAREIVFIIVLIGTLLALLANGFTWTALVFCVIMGAYIFFDFITDSLVFSILMFFIMFFIISLTMSGWMDIMGIEVEKVAQQTGFYEAITQSMDALSAGFGDVWFMITDPYGWQTKQQMEAAAKKGEGETDRALEITTVRVTPNIVNRGDEAMIMVEVENFGKEDTTRPARDAVVYLKRITEYDNPAFNVVLETGTDIDVKYVGDILSGTSAQEGFDVTAPSGCVGTFRLQAGVHYGYDVDAIGDVFVIDRERYGELTKQDQLDPEKQVTTSTSGPVSVSLKTNLPQPIPVVKGCDIDPATPNPDCKQFSLFFGIMNTKSSNGVVTVKDVEIEMPKQFKPSVVGINSDGGDKYNCRLCLINSEDNIYSLKYLYLGKKWDVKDSDPTEDGVCTFAAKLPVQSENYLEVTGDMNIFKCDMYYQGDAGEDVYFKKPLNVKVNIDYEYNSTKEVSFSVRKQMTDDPETVVKCSN